MAEEPTRDKADRSPGEGQPGLGVRAIHQRRRTTAAGVQPQVLLQRTREPEQPAVVDRVEASLTDAPAHAVVPRAPGLAPASAYAPSLQETRTAGISSVDLLPHQNEVGIRYAVGRSEMIYGGTELGRYPREGIPRSYHVVGSTTRIGLARGILVAYGIDVTVVCAVTHAVTRAVVSAVACGGARFTSDASTPFHVPRHKADARRGEADRLGYGGGDVQVASGYVGSAVDDGHVIGARALVADRKFGPERERVMRRSPRRGCEDLTRGGGGSVQAGTVPGRAASRGLGFFCHAGGRGQQACPHQGSGEQQQFTHRKSPPSRLHKGATIHTRGRNANVRPTTYVPEYVPEVMRNVSSIMLRIVRRMRRWPASRRAEGRARVRCEGERRGAWHLPRRSHLVHQAS